MRTIIFGDAGGTDIRASRAARLAGSGIDAAFPLWGMGTRQLSRQILASGIRAVVTRIDPFLIEPRWLGQPFAEGFLGALGKHADPCGEHGEFHTFTCDGPGFGRAIAVTTRGVRHQDGAVYAEVTEADVPAGGSAVQGWCGHWREHSA